ncbi:unnamed protein product [Paramecium sonneborni]|uniref:Uncharacterized protein n=1 Tax=Paramecium sonneborni TaxID=65129 RepID=A0A8S1MIA2_9CILI|nr:unnamed protein product [Paramecium sonneborni]
MGICISTNQSGLLINNTDIKNNDEKYNYSLEENQIDVESPEICLLDTNELHKNSVKATKEQCQREQVNRIVNVHDQSNSQRYFFVYDQLYNVKRKVPKLKSISQSTLIQKRKQQIL